VSRRQFFQAAAGATGVALGASLLSAVTPILYASDDESAVLPNPISESFTAFGHQFHFVLPASGAEPSTITDFKGIVGVAHVGGTGTGSDSSGSNSLIFDADCRFMKGVYVGVDGEVHRGAAGFVWLDLYTGGAVGSPNPTTQIHDFNPGINPFPGGLFWTFLTDPSNIRAHPGNGSATFKVSNFALEDYFNLANALQDGPEVAAVVESLDIDWGRHGKRVVTKDSTNGFSLDAIENTASMEWSAHNANGFRFVSAPAETSTSLFAEVGREDNGVFFSDDDKDN
jgi:hypothetical protein